MCLPRATVGLTPRLTPPPDSHAHSRLAFPPSAMEFHENLHDLATKEGLKGRKLHKAVESFTWNITILKVRPQSTCQFHLILELVYHKVTLTTLATEVISSVCPCLSMILFQKPDQYNYTKLNLKQHFLVLLSVSLKQRYIKILPQRNCQSDHTKTPKQSIAASPASPTGHMVIANNLT